MNFEGFRRVLGGGGSRTGMGADGNAGNPGPPKALKSKKITKTLKLLVTSRKHD